MTSRPRVSSTNPPTAPEPGARPEAPFADLAELVLSIARELALRAGPAAGQVRLTATEIHVMRYISKHPGTLPKDAAQGVGLQRSNFSVALRGLKDRGLVAAVPDEHDGRSMRLFPTGVASRTLKHRRTQWAAFLATALPETVDVRACLEVLAQVERALSTLRKDREQV